MIELEVTEDIRVFDINYITDQGTLTLDGEITNKYTDGAFIYRTDSYEYSLNSEQLRLIADKLDDLNENHN